MTEINNNTATPAQSNKERLKAITDSIEAGIQDLFQSEKYAEYLRTMSRFHRYSLNNTMLIFMQKPDATRVAGFNKWRDSFGRSVKKGERGITIIAPTPYKKKIEQEKLDPDTHQPLVDENGKIITEEKEIHIPLYRPVKVFDVAQTEGKPLPQLASDLSGNVQNYELFMEALKRSAPVPISIEPITDGSDGFFSAKEQRIVLREGMSEVQTVSAAVHELAHSILYNNMNKSAEDKSEQKDRRTEEVEAESISYSVCAYYGIETGENSFGYLASWSKDKELSELKASLETITKTADSIITDIDRNYAILMKEQSIEQTQETKSTSYPCLPDPSVSIAAMKYYGYEDDTMLPLSRGRAKELFSKDMTVYMLNPDGTEAMIFDASDLDRHNGLFGIAREEWESISPKAAEQENYLKSAEMSTEDDYDMLDGILNNGNKEAMEKRPSLLAQLRQPMANHHQTKSVPHKGAEMEI